MLGTRKDRFRGLCFLPLMITVLGMNIKSCSKLKNGLNYTLPMYNPCKEALTGNDVIQMIPKLTRDTSTQSVRCRRQSKLGIPYGRRACRIPDCRSNPCISGWCEETMEGYRCHCPSQFTDSSDADMLACPRQADVNIRTSSMKPDNVITTAHPISTPTTDALSTLSTSPSSPAMTTSQFSTTPLSGIRCNFTELNGVKMFVTDETKKMILIAGFSAMNFREFCNLSSQPFNIFYDNTNRMIYWTEHGVGRIIHADIVTMKIGHITFNHSTGPHDFAIDTISGVMYCAFRDENKITMMKLGESSSEETFVTNTYTPRAIVIDRRSEFIYWTRSGGIDRKALNQSGEIQTIFEKSPLTHITGLDIDEYGRTLFCCDFMANRAFSVNVSEGSDVELTDHMLLEHDAKLLDVNFFNGTLYFLTREGVAVLKNYADNATRHFSFHDVPTLVKAQRLVVANIEV